MNEIYFYRDTKDREPVMDYIVTLAQSNSKDSRIKLNKINDYIQALSLYGTLLGEPYIKHLDGAIWELRPIRDRILFAPWEGGGFILLHHFVKKSRKTPLKEIEKAKRELEDAKERRNEDE